jgi:hypothetical protein
LTFDFFIQNFSYTFCNKKFFWCFLAAFFFFFFFWKDDRRTSSSGKMASLPMPFQSAGSSTAHHHVTTPRMSCTTATTDDEHRARTRWRWSRRLLVADGCLVGIRILERRRASRMPLECRVYVNPFRQKQTPFCLSWQALALLHLHRIPSWAPAESAHGSRIIILHRPLTITPPRVWISRRWALNFCRW